MATAWTDIVRTTVPQYPLTRYGALSVVSKAKVDELIVAGYASPQVVDRDKHVITREALAKDLPRFMAHPHYRNVNLLHSNVQVGEVIPSWTDPETDETYETKVDEIGLFVVVKIRTDEHRPPIADKVIDDIKSGKIASFSISADAPFESRRHECAGGTCFWVINEVILYEVTVCETPVNQDAKFAIISKSAEGVGEFAASAFCLDGTCPITPGQAGRLLKGYRSASGQMLFEGSEQKAEGPKVAGLAVLASDTGRVLMLQRALDEKDPAGGTWEFPGGHIEDGETPRRAAEREWQEEVGIELPAGKMLSKWRSPDDRYVGYVYRVESEAGLPIFSERGFVTNPDDPDGDQLEAVAWWDPATLDDNSALREELAAELPSVLEALDKVSPMAEKAGDSDSTRGEFEMGMEQESREHLASVGGDERVIANLVRDHLREDPHYYSKQQHDGASNSSHRALKEDLGQATPRSPELKRAIVAPQTSQGRAEGRYDQNHYESPHHPVDGVSPTAEQSDLEDEVQYLNLATTADPFDTHGGFELVEGDLRPTDPQTRGPKRRPKLAGPSSYTPIILKEIREVLELALDSVRLSKSEATKARAVLASLQKGSRDLTWMPDRKDAATGDLLVWVDGTTFDVPAGYVAVGRLVKTMTRYAVASGDGRLTNSLGLLSRQVAKSRPLQGDDALEAVARIAREASYSMSAPASFSVIAKAWGDNFRGRHQAAIEAIAEQIALASRPSNARRSLDPLTAAALDTLHEDAQTVLDGIRLGTYVKMDEEPEHDIIKESGADDTYRDVEAADKLLDRMEKAVDKGDTILTPEETRFEEEQELKGGPENLPGKYEVRHVEASGAEDPRDKVGAFVAAKPDDEEKNDAEHFAGYDPNSDVESGDSERPKHTGAMIAWYPTSGQARQLAQEGGETADQLHVTLVHFRDGAAVREKLEGVKAAISVAVEPTPPMNGTISGMGRFNPSNSSDGKHPFVALVDVPGLSRFRARLIDELEKTGIDFSADHDFTPHMTIRYEDSPGMDDMQERGIPSIETTPISVDKVWLVVEDDKVEVFSLDKGVGQVSKVPPAKVDRGFVSPGGGTPLPAHSGTPEEHAARLALAWNEAFPNAPYRLAVVPEGGR